MNHLTFVTSAVLAAGIFIAASGVASALPAYAPAAAVRPHDGNIESVRWHRAGGWHHHRGWHHGRRW